MNNCTHDFSIVMTTRRTATPTCFCTTTTNRTRTCIRYPKIANKYKPLLNFYYLFFKIVGPQDHWSTVVVRTLLWCSNRQHLDNWTSFALTFSWPFCLDRGPKYLMLLNFLFPKWTGPPLQVLRLLMVKNVVILFCSDYISIERVCALL